MFMIKLAKILLLTVHLLYGVVLIIVQVRLLGRKPQDPAFVQQVQRWYQRSCKLVGLTLVVEQGEVINGPVLLVSNHISWLDIPVIASVCTPRFLSKSEVRRWPLIGWAAEQLHTLFIHRGNHSAAEAASAAIVEGLQQQDRILIFPEGTTSDGQGIGFFYPRLFGAAIACEAPVQPIVIHYTDDNSDGHTSKLAAFIGKQTLVQNLWGLLGSRNLTAHVYIMQPVTTTEAGLTRKALAAQTQASVQQVLAKSQADYQAPLIHK